MARVAINQPVDVHSHPPGGAPGDDHVHAFNNLIPACEFAVALAAEGHLDITLQTAWGGVVTLDEARRIAKIWESGAVALDATHLDF